jgi:hypothetical protein
MIAGLDSSAVRPDAETALQAKASGISLWSGYLATKAGVRLAAPWTLANFDNARLCGGTPIAFCSGLDDPLACKALADQWNVRLCLDVESGIRGDGAWVQPWLDASGAGLYGNAPIHAGRNAAFHVLAAYPGFDPQATWEAGVPRPSTPSGWQWQGTHTEFGIPVDRGWFDDWFLGAKKEVGMIMLQSSATGDVQFVSGGLVCHVDAPATVTALKQAGVPYAVVDDLFHNTVVAAGKALVPGIGTGLKGLTGSINLTAE